MVPTVKLKRRVVVTEIFDIIIRKFGYWWELGPVILFKIDKNIWIAFNDTILSLRLNINLRVERGRETTLDVKEVAKG